MIRNAFSFVRVVHRFLKPNCGLLEKRFLSPVAGNNEMSKTLDFEQVKTGLENESLIYLDVRNPGELLSDGKVVGSVNVPLPEIEEAFALNDQDFQAKYRFVKPKPESKNIVTACFAGKRAAAAADKLKEMFGYNSIMVYPGSFSDWKNKGGPITKE